MNDEIPMGAGAIIVNADTGEIVTIPLTPEQILEMKLVQERLDLMERN